MSRRAGQVRFRRWQKLALAAVALAAVTLAALQLTGAFDAPAAPAASASPKAAARAAGPSVAPRPAPSSASVSPAAAAAQSKAAAWISSQVSSAAIIGCYPAMCASLQAQGIGASRLMPLGPGLAGVLTTDVIVTAPGADGKLVLRYAPGLIASFGAGGARIEVRAVAPRGAAAYQAALRADLAARMSAGPQLLENTRLRFSAADAARLRAGEVDSRLLATLVTLSSQFKLRVATFGDSSPGVRPLFRGVTVAIDGTGNSPASLTAALRMVSAQQRPYLPAHCAIVALEAGQPGLSIEFAEPSPLGLLTPVLTAAVRGARSD